MAGRVVTIAQQKGGAGKTTLAIHLAVAWSLAGRRVATVDIDPQGSLSEWARLRAAALNGSGPALTHVQVSGWRVQKEVERLAREHDMVVIDSPPHAETEARIAIRAAGLVVVPVQPSPMDLWATRPTLEVARAEKRPALLVLNRVPSRGKLVDAVAARAQELGVPVADAAIGNRIGFAGAILEGLTLMETDRRAKGVEEIEDLAAEILRRAG
ncbi:ParA family partition ATPase [Rhodospirillum centenum]|uniref:ATPase involved in chromosome partitioning, putative n=1 Tax=Rhodospirillum centenum (strain ATCC 51521 / SW) TaxID=414684 RepID=B6IND3_RHOCS|nr:ParA family partition ATPase [Rhodospirillum centenum]ACI99030.1 ATPase involved in chromosome partitioning, putative [Rhodospirillum centenum SW]